MKTSYRQKQTDVLLNHSHPKKSNTQSNSLQRTTERCVHDGTFDEPEQQKQNVHVAVASGDYFMNLATTLDGIEDIMEHPEIERIIQDLYTLDQSYKIVKK